MELRCACPWFCVRGLLSLVFCLALVSCSPENRIEGYVYYRLNANPTTLDPALVVDVAGGSLAAKLFNGLVRIDDDLGIRPDIAEHWKVSGDGLTYSFRLRKGVTFSHKREVMARDFKYSFERILDPHTKSPNTWIFEKIVGAREYMAGRHADVRGIKAVDERTLEIVLVEPFSPFLSHLAMTAAYVVPREEVERMGPAFSAHPVGTGPFVLGEWLPGGGIRLERRGDYFDGPANVNGIMYRVIPEDLTAVMEFETGNIDVLAIPASEFPRYRADRGMRRFISSVRGLNTYYIGFNCARPPFENVALRKAVAQGIDREKMLHTIYAERGRLAWGPVPDALRGWRISFPYSYNPAKARDLRARAGGEVIAVNLYITAEQEVVDIAEVIQSYLREIGIEVKIRQLEWSAYKEAINRGDADMFYLSWWADYPDPENFLFPLFHSSNLGPAGNRTRYRNTKVDSLIERGRHTLEKRSRESFYQKAEAIIMEEAPMVFLWHRTDFTIRQPWIENYRAYPVYSMDKGTDVSFSRAR